MMHAAGQLASEEFEQLLWHDTSIFQERFEKSASAFIALRRTLERHQHRFPAAAEFLADCEQLVADAAAFDAVWRDPYAYFWVRGGFDLLGSLLRGEPLPAPARRYATELAGRDDPEAAFVLHLQQCKRLVLGACALAGSDCRFETPLQVDLPLALPGLGRSLLGSGRVEILGIRSGALRIESGREVEEIALDGSAQAGAGVRVEPCPRIDVLGRELWLQPHLYHLPGLGLFQPSTQSDFAFSRRNRGLVVDALALVERHDAHSHALLSSLIRVLGIQERNPEGYRDNVSHSDLPGAILACAAPHPYYLADVLIHESHHNRLFFVEEIAPFLEGAQEDLEAESRYCSPWREDLRPLHGLLHGAYVFVPTTRFWLRVLQGGEVAADTRALALDRAVRGLRQTRIGLHQLRRYAQFSPFGRGVFARLERDVAALEAEFRAADMPSDAPFVTFHPDGRVETAKRADGSPLGGRDALIAHLERSGAPDQARDIVQNAL